MPALFISITQSSERIVAISLCLQRTTPLCFLPRESDETAATFKMKLTTRQRLTAVTSWFVPKIKLFFDWDISFKIQLTRLLVAYGKWPLTRVKTILGQNFSSLGYGNCKVHNCASVLFMLKSISRKNPVLPIGKFPFLVLPRNTIMLQHLVIQFPLYYLSGGRLRKVKSKRKFQTFSSQSGRGR